MTNEGREQEVLARIAAAYYDGTCEYADEAISNGIRKAAGDGFLPCGVRTGSGLFLRLLEICAKSQLMDAVGVSAILMATHGPPVLITPDHSAPPWDCHVIAGGAPRPLRVLLTEPTRGMAGEALGRFPVSALE